MPLLQERWNTYRAWKSMRFYNAKITKVTLVRG
jgi:hypothetical protein